jgi:cell division protein ZapD
MNDNLDTPAFTGLAPVKQNNGMSSEAAEVGATVVDAAVVPFVFEQPLTERMRTFLRLDFLYNQALFHNQSPSQWGSRAAVASLLDMMSITTRADTRADVLKELERQISVLNEFQAKPGVDSARLRTVVSNLLRLRSDLLATGTGYLQSLKESDFLSAIKHRSAIPGGTCEFDLPDYCYWLNQSYEARGATFAQWLALLRPLCDAIAELLWLTRQSGRARTEVARGGVYHITFDRETPVQLMRISVPQSLGIFPEISGSHHRSSVRFVTWRGATERPVQAEGDITFELTCCT